MKIGIDLDEVTVNLMDTISAFYYQRTGKLFKRADFYTFDIWKVWGITREEQEKISWDFYNSPFFDNMAPIKDSVESITHLAEREDVYFVTSRHITQREKTEEWLRRHLKSAFPIIFSSDFHREVEAKTKVEICQELGIGTIVEDNGGYALSCAEAGIKAILFDRPWNQGVEHDNLTRVSGWKEAMPYF